MPDETAQKLVEMGVTIKEMPTNRGNGNKSYAMDYMDDIDLPEFKLLPTYKRMCVCILKNDHTAKFMGFAPTKTETLIRSQAEKKYSNL